MDSVPEKTFFYDLHAELGAKIVDFHGFLLPIQYQSILDEHHWVRKSCGLFDVSHMGKIHLINADKLLNQLTPSHLDRVNQGQIIYSALLYEDGSPVDDILLYRLAPKEWLMVVNAANRPKVADYLAKRLGALSPEERQDIAINDVTQSHLQLALQGPMATAVLSQIVGPEIDKLDYYAFTWLKFRGQSLLVSRTGYTGEDGFEIYGGSRIMVDVWQELVQDERVRPVGLGARDSLRLEARYPLYGQELAEGRSIIASGIGWIIYWEKDFVGKGALAQAKANGAKNHIHAYIMAEGGVPRTGYDVLNAAGEKIGFVTSGGHAPSLNKGILLAYLEKPSEQATQVSIHGKNRAIQEINGTFVPNRTLRGKAGLKKQG